MVNERLHIATSKHSKMKKDSVHDEDTKKINYDRANPKSDMVVNNLYMFSIIQYVGLNSSFQLLIRNRYVFKL